MTAQSLPDFGSEEYSYSPVPGQYRLTPHGPWEKHRAARKTCLVLGRAMGCVRRLRSRLLMT